ncbi:MAG TPA: NAD-dependent succinate-semialdehyde dehydrogenase [Cellvibrio sp.]|nr:NAD-dependent succinate-semialdehyde dehydrogenase [Cellvibrio sp.]
MTSLPDSLLMRRLGFINGEWCPADSGNTFSVCNPATGQVIAWVADMGATETHRAINAAAQAQLHWAQKTAKSRSQVMRTWFDLVIQHQDELAHILTLEQGKPLAEARSEIAYGASYIDWFAEEAKRIYGDVIAPANPDQRILVIKQPVGVVAAITPWNFPCAMLARKIAPALAAGCSIVAKPAAETPLSALALAHLAQQAGIPAGVINIVTGKDSAAIGTELTGNPLVRKLSFTGSTATGKTLMQQCAGDVKRLSMELGGNAPFIVFEDADLDAAVVGAMASKFRNAGQTCVCANRFYVHRSIYQEFSEKLLAAMKTLVIGNGMDSRVTLGPLISTKAIDKVTSLVADAQQKGARLEYRADVDANLVVQGYFYPPTLLLDVPADAELNRQEIFGPVAGLVAFDTDEEVIELANDTEFGLAAYCYTYDTKRIRRLSQQLEVGMLGINNGLISNEMAPFGGIKQSGWGREGSRYGIEDYLNIKYLCESF